MSADTLPCGRGGIPVVGRVPLWMYAKPPATPHAHDTDFSGGSLPSGWALNNPGSLTAATVTAAERLKLTQATHVGQGWGAVLRAAPSANAYNVNCSIRARGILENYVAWGLMIAGTDAFSDPTTFDSAIIACELKTNAVDTIILKYDAYDDASPSVDGNLVDETFSLFRWAINISGGRAMGLVSRDGRDWTAITDVILSSCNLAGTSPAYIGPALNNFNTSQSAAIVVDHYSIQETSDQFAPLGGYVDIGVAHPA